MAPRRHSLATPGERASARGRACVFSGQKRGRRRPASRPLGTWKQSEAGGWDTALPDAMEKLRLAGQSCPHGPLAQRIPGCHPVKHQLARSPRQPGLGGAPRVPAAGHAEGSVGQLLSCSAGLSSNPLGPTPLDPGGAEGGAARISVSVLRADQLHVEAEHTARTFSPALGPARLPRWIGRGWGVGGGGQRTVGHSFSSAHPPETKGQQGGSGPVSQLPRLPVCLGLIPV